MINVSLQYLFFVFLKIGSTSWGGFMSLIAVIQKQLTERDKKINNETLAEAISLASVLPGPIAVNVVAYLGYKLKGWKGALISIAAIVLPSFIFMMLISGMYLRYGNIPALRGFFTGVMPAVAAIIISVAVGMAKKNITDLYQVLIATAAGVIVFLSKSYFSTLLILTGGGLIGYLLYRNKKGLLKTGDIKTGETIAPIPGRRNTTVIIAAILFILMVLSFCLKAGFFNNLNIQYKIFSTFFSISVTQFGGGYVIIPSLQKAIVSSSAWLTNKEFTDAIAMSQVTPGPIFIIATFIGYKLAGFAGALNATISVFLPAAVLIVLCSHYFNRIRESIFITAAFKGIRPVIIGMIFSAAVTILTGIEFSTGSAAIFLVSLIAVVWKNLSPVYLVPLAGIIGVFVFK